MQDNVGRTVLETCRVVPDGVLVFMPSYALLERLVQRWQVSTLMLQGDTLASLTNQTAQSRPPAPRQKT